MANPFDKGALQNLTEFVEDDLRMNMGPESEELEQSVRDIRQGNPKEESVKEVANFVSDDLRHNLGPESEYLESSLRSVFEDLER